MKAVHYVSPTEFSLLLSLPDRHTQTGNAKYLALLLMYRTGLRVSEIAKLTIPDVDMRHRRVRAAEWVDRWVPYDEVVEEAIHRWLPYQNQFRTGAFVVTLEGNPISLYDVREWVTLLPHQGRFTKGMEALKGVTPPALRYSCAVNLLREGCTPAQVVYLMGRGSQRLVDQALEETAKV